ncbi:MAG: amino acid adenylation domain-containing protein [Roseitalea sp.]|jgi:amino acid adenylation domain-containing protein|nr:amino acid adenylation domain-containing protein [Roseitalea sp.]MBO6720994.1 amino acid adenylation domain-containing protein [Roseitalea sp.]MBO6742934.1 amino acid adenylation domain-containing protein [Roseitalea sp.]
MLDRPSDDIRQRVRALPVEGVRLLWNWLESGPGADLNSTIPRCDRTGTIPLSHAQERLWFVEQLLRGPPVYNLADMVPLELNPNVSLVAQALNQLQIRHETLRTRFVLDGLAPVQRISDPGPVPLKTIDIAAANLAEELAATDAAIAAEIAMPFNLQEGPVFRAVLLRRSQDALLVLLMHHIVGDGWSLQLAKSELLADYHGLVAGTYQPAPVPSIQYADYAAWQRNALRGASMDRMRRFWSGALSELPALCSLPTDLPRPPIESHRGRTLSLRLPGDLVDQVERAADASGTTLFMFTMAAFQAIVQRWTGRNDTIIGTPVAGRGRAETAPLIGLFVNMLPFRMRFDDSPTISDLLAAVRSFALEAFEHEEFPFEQMVEEVNPDRLLSHHPLFQIAFSFDDWNRESAWGNAAGTEGEDSLDGVSKFDLTLGVIRGKSGWTLRCEYAVDLFEVDTIRTLMTQYQAMLAAFAGDRTRRVNALLSADQEPVPVPQDMSSGWAGRLRDLAARGSTTVLAGSKTAGQFLEHLDQAAGRAESAGAPDQTAATGCVGIAETLDALVSGRTIDLDGVASSIAPSTAQAAVAAWIDVLELEPHARVVQLDGAGGPLLPLAAVCAGAAWRDQSADIDARTVLVVRAETLSKIDPSELPLPHLVCVVASRVWDHAVIAWRDRTRLVHAVVPDGIFAPIVAGPVGGTLTAPAAMGTRVAAGNRQCATRVQGRLAVAGAEAAPAAGDMPFAHLRPDGGFAIVPGDGPQAHVAWIGAYFHQHSAIDQCRVQPNGAGFDVHIRSIAGRSIDEGALLAEAREALGPDLRVSGLRAIDQPIEGPDAAADPVAPADLVRGETNVLPRTATEVLIARIWSDVLERQTVGIAEDFFALGGSSLASIKVIARIAEATGVNIELHRIFEARTVAQLAQVVDASLSATGASDARQGSGLLTRLGLDLEDMSETEIDALVQSLDAFEINLLIADLGNGEDMPIDDLGDSSIDDRRAFARSLLLRSQRKRVAYPLTYAQERLWFLSQLAPDSAAYNLPLTMRFAQALDPVLVRRALNALTRRHAALRTVFRMEDDQIVQRVVADHDMPLSVHHTADHAGTGSAADLMHELKERPFDLANQPPVRADLIDAGSAGALLLVDMHHIISDGWSLGILDREFRHLYASLAAGEQDDLPALPETYAGYVGWLGSPRKSAQQKADLAYFCDRLRDAPPLLRLPIDRPRPQHDSFGGAAARFRLDGVGRADVEDLCKSEGATPFICLLTVFMVLLGRYAGRTDPVVGSPVSGRSEVEFEGIVGFFVNMLVLNADLEGNPSFRTAMARVRETVSEAIGHDSVPFEQLVESLQPARTLGWNPVFQVAFALQEAATSQAEGHDRPDFARTLVRGSSKFDLTLQFVPTGNGYEGGIEFKTDLFDPETAHCIAQQYTGLARALIGDPDMRIDDVQLWTPPEAVRNKTPATADETWSARVASFATTMPDRIAFRDRTGALSYKELLALARGETGAPPMEVGQSLAMLIRLLSDLMAVERTEGEAPPHGERSDIDDRALGTLAVAFGAHFAISQRSVVAITDHTGDIEALAPALIALANGACVQALGASDADVSHLILPAETVAGLQPDDFPALERLSVLGDPVWARPLLAWTRDTVTVERVCGPEGLLGMGAAAALDDADCVTPMNGMALTVVGGDGPCPAGVPGFLAVCGPQVIRPREGGENGRIGGALSTGLPARKNATGRIRLIGHEDDDAAFLTSVLRQHPGIADALVVASGPSQGHGLTGYVVARSGRHIDTEALVRTLHADFPQIARLNDLQRIDELPSDADRPLSPDMLAPREEQGPTDTEPRTNLEAVLVRIWREVLKAPHVGIRDNFFSIGGNSLASVMVVNRIRETLGIGLELHLLFEAPTIAELAPLLREQMTGRTERADGQGENPADPAAPVGGDDIVPSQAPAFARHSAPLSMAQERLWFLEQLDLATGLYNMPICLSLTEPGISTDRIRDALNALVARHEVFRTRFVSIAGIPQQSISEEAMVSLTEVWIDGADPHATDLEIGRLITQAAHRKIDLLGPVLLVPTLVRTAARGDFLILLTHHIICDGWSVNVLMRDLGQLLQRSVSGDGEAAAPDLPDLELHYADFARWERRRASTATMQGHLAYFRDRLEGAPAVLDLPGDRPRPSVQTHRGAIQHFSIAESLSKRLADFAAARETTPFVVLLTVFKVLLARLSGSDDIVVGTPIANRSRLAFENVVGLFANTLVLRTALPADLSFEEALAHVGTGMAEAQKHQELPFEKLVEAIHPRRSLSHNPLFQVMMVMQNQPNADFGFAPTVAHPAEEEVTHEPQAVQDCLTKFDLTLTFAPSAKGFAASVEYATDLFDAQTIGRWNAHFQVLLASAMDAPHEAIDRLALCEAVSLDTVNAKAPIPAGHADAEMSVIARFERQAARTPDAIALIDGHRRLSYGALEHRAGRLATRLAAAGAGPGTVVALAAPRGAELLVALLGIVKTGAAYVPVDPAYPEARRGFMIADSGARLIVAPAGAVEPVANCTRVWLDDEPASPKAPSMAPPAKPAGRDPLYCIYTSGSTGNPKGVSLPHSVLAQLTAWQIGRLRAGPGDIVLQFASISFDVSAQEIFSTLGSGGTLVLADEATRANPAALLDLMRRTGVTRAFLPYVALQALAEEHAHGSEDPMPLAALRHVITAGEQLRITPAIRSFFSEHQQAALFNQYGPSETHVVSECALDPDASRWPMLPPIGRPAAGARLYVLSPNLEPVPVGVVGEIFIGGDALAHGYANRPGQTARRFVPDPFAIQAGARMYASGDLGRVRADGTVDYTGRKDGQVKLHGYRIELGEIEGQLSAVESVLECAVVVQTLGPDHRALIAYVVGTETLSVKRALAHLRDRLPAHMVPDHLIALDALPLTPSGKLDRRALPLPRQDIVSADRKRPAQASGTPIEGALVAQWQKLLASGELSAESNFFEAGGHSLLATRACADVHKLVGIPISVRQLFDHPTARGLSDQLTATLAEKIKREEAYDTLSAVEQSVGANTTGTTA